MTNLKELFLEKLMGMYDAEHRICKALPKMAKSATSEALKEALLNHQKETVGQIQKLKDVFYAFDEKPRGKECKATVGLLEEGKEIAANNNGKGTLNAGLISACQKVEYYEIASYRCLIEWAKLLEREEAIRLLDEILEEETAAHEILTTLAGDANQEAVQHDEVVRGVMP